MSEKFDKRWNEKKEKRSFGELIREAVRPPSPVKPRLDMAVRRIELQIQKLDQANERFNERDKSIFARIVDAYSKHDIARAKVFASELAEIRKMEKMIMQARLALEQIVLRLRTVSELGDIITTIGPAVNVLTAVKNGMANIFPEAEKDFGQIGNLLSGIVAEAGQSTGVSINFEAANEDAQRILTEAATIAEQRIKERLPELPAAIPSASSTEKSGKETL